MSFLKSFFIVLFSSFFFLLLTGSEQDQHHVCLNSDIFVPYGYYEINLKELFSYLTFETPSTGFGMGSKGSGPNRAHGSALCRGDVSPMNCMICITKASNEVLSLCPNSKSAILWYEFCVLKYSNENFFGEIDYKNWYYVDSPQNVSDPTSFGNKTQELLSQITEEATLNPKMYAAGKVKVNGSHTVHGLVQCSRDLTSEDCKKCQMDSVSWLATCCSASAGVRVYSGTCSIRYELYKFFNVSK